MTRSAVLTVRNARLAYGAIQALDGVSFQLFPGEILGLLGPNGAGKTSLFKCLSGVRKLDAGRIQCHLPGDYRDLIGSVPQEIALYGDLTVRQNITAFARFNGASDREIGNTLEEALAWSRLEQKANALVKTLSGGMQRRLNIVCGALHRPQILLLDEPTVGIDPQSREHIYEMLTGLLARQTAVLLATHHLEEAQQRCHRIAVLDQGRIIDAGNVDELLERSVGKQQWLQVRFTTAQTSVPKPLRLAKSRMEASCTIADTTRQLPLVLKGIQRADLPIENLSLRSPTLQHMFLHLTGKELRE